MATITLEEVFTALKAVHRDIRKIRQHIEDPTGEKAKARSENNGFKKPIQVDDSLRAFLNLTPDQMISRSEVTRAINVYAEKNNLKNGQNIKMDDTLRKLLNPPAGEDVTFLTLQKYLAPHYVKSVKETPKVEEKKIEVKSEDVVAPKKPRVAKK